MDLRFISSSEASQRGITGLTMHNEPMTPRSLVALVALLGSGGLLCLAAPSPAAQQESQTIEVVVEGNGEAASRAAPPDKHAARVAAHRQGMEAYFRDHSFSPLRAIERFDFKPGATAPAVIGSAEGSDLRLEGHRIDGRQLTIAILPPDSEGDPHRFRLENLGGAGSVVADGELLGAAGTEGAVRTVLAETPVALGTFAIRPYVQGGAGILIVFDSRRTTPDRFVPPRHFPVDPAWRFRAKLIPSSDPEILSLETSLGRKKEYRRAGHFELLVDREKVRVFAYQPTFLAHSEGMLSILFSDRTSGQESYGAGRYIDLDPPADGLYTIDFNLAYNPYCSYTDVFNCPIPPRENRLEVAVRAGEKNYPNPAK